MMISRWQWLLLQLTRTLWIRVALFCLLAVATALVASEAAIVGELSAAQGKAVDLGGYYHGDAVKTASVMRPSGTLNGIIG